MTNAMTHTLRALGLAVYVQSLYTDPNHGVSIGKATSLLRAALNGYEGGSEAVMRVALEEAAFHINHPRNEDTRGTPFRPQLLGHIADALSLLGGVKAAA